MSVSEFLWTVKTALYRLFRQHVPPFSTIFRVEKRALERWLRRVEGSGLWLDLGCGEGTTFDLAEWKGSKVGVDRVKHLLERGGRQRKAHWVCGAAGALPFRGERADLVSAVGLVEYVRDRPRFWGELWNVLRPGGVAVVTAARPGLLNALRWLLGHRVSTAGREELEREVQEAGFVVKETHATLLQWQFFLLKPETERVGR